MGSKERRKVTGQSEDTILHIFLMTFMESNLRAKWFSDRETNYEVRCPKGRVLGKKMKKKVSHGVYNKKVGSYRLSVYFYLFSSGMKRLYVCLPSHLLAFRTIGICPLFN
jgi:hypothetical protein